jgi:hypothetical protein
MTTKIPNKAKLPATVQESIWLAEVRLGASLQTIADRENKTRRWIEYGVTRARLREFGKQSRLDRLAAEAAEERKELRTTSNAPTAPRLIPLFPIGSFTPTTTCGHHGPIRAGSIFCCMVCHTSGMDDHPALMRDPKTDPAPEPTSPPASTDLAPTPGRRRLKQQPKRTAANAATAI